MSKRKMKGSTLRRIRRELGLTQEEMADELDADPQTISNWERGLYAIPYTVGLAVLGLAEKGRAN